MRTSVTLALLAGLLVGCAHDPCDGQAGSCITLELRSEPAVTLDTVTVGVDQPPGAGTVMTTPALPRAVSTPFAIAILPPAGMYTTRFAVSVSRAGQVTATGESALFSIQAGEHRRIAVDLLPLGGPPDDLAGVDLAGVDLALPTERYVFAGSLLEGTELNGLKSADDRCLELATSTASKVPHANGERYVAILSPPSTGGPVDPLQHLGLSAGALPIVLPSPGGGPGPQVSTDEEFWKGSHAHEIDRDHTGASVNGDCVWTAFKADGTQRTPVLDCNGWLGPGPAAGYVGSTDRTDERWAAEPVTFACTVLCRFYCIQVP